MLSGALILPNKVTDFKAFYKKRFYRIVGPYLIAVLFFVVAHNYNSGMLNIFRLFLRSLFTGEAYNTFWFVYAILGLYIISPFLTKMLANLNEQEKKYLFFVLIFMQILSVYMSDVDGIHTIAQYTFFIGNGVYYILGYFVDEFRKNYNEFHGKNSILICLLIEAAGYVIIALFYKTDSIILYSNSLIQIFVSISLYILLCELSTTINKISIYRKISELSYWVYLFHPVFLSMPLKILSGIKINLTIKIIIISLLTFIASLIFSYLVNYIYIKLKYYLKVMLNCCMPNK
jgi:surface polysaccharide O-acyltransferase-like enzyme